MELRRIYDTQMPRWSSRCISRSSLWCSCDWMDALQHCLYQTIHGSSTGKSRRLSQVVYFGQGWRYWRIAPFLSRFSTAGRACVVPPFGCPCQWTHCQEEGLQFGLVSLRTSRSSSSTRPRFSWRTHSCVLTKITRALISCASLKFYLETDRNLISKWRCITKIVWFGIIL